MKNGRWVHEDQNIYSEIEIRYLSSALSNMVNTANNEDFGNNEGKIIINKHKDKTLHTLEILMTQLNMMFYWENINY